MMGRKSHNLTDEQKYERQLKWRMQSYWRHVDVQRQKAKERYHKNKKNVQDEKYKES